MRVSRGATLSLRGVALLYLGLLLLLPLALVFIRTFEHGVSQAWGWVTTPAAISALWLTILIALIAVPLNTIFGIVCAHALIRGKARGRAIVDALIDLPFVVSPVIVGLALTLVYGASGWFGSWFLHQGIRIIYAPAGLILPPRPAPTPDVQAPGIVFIVGGIGGWDMLPHPAQFALPRAGVRHQLRDFVWTHGVGHFFRALQAFRHLVVKAEEALQKAAHYGHPVGKREMAQLADGYRHRADRTWRESRSFAHSPSEERDYLTKARDDYMRAQDLYRRAGLFGDAGRTQLQAIQGQQRIEQRLNQLEEGATSQ